MRKILHTPGLPSYLFSHWGYLNLFLPTTILEFFAHARQTNYSTFLHKKHTKHYFTFLHKIHKKHFFHKLRKLQKLQKLIKFQKLI